MTPPAPPSPPPTTPAARGAPPLMVMLSGAGSTLVNLAERIKAGTLQARITLVVASRPCPGIERAHERAIPVILEPGEIPPARLEQLALQAGLDLSEPAVAGWMPKAPGDDRGGGPEDAGGGGGGVVLAGYLRRILLPPSLRHRIVNIHPSLLPAFGGKGMYGERIHTAVLEAGCKVTGCTAHLCDDEFDRGPILVQRACEVMEGDDAHTLGARVAQLEREALPTAITMLLDGCVHLRQAAAHRSIESRPSSRAV